MNFDEARVAYAQAKKAFSVHGKGFSYLINRYWTCRKKLRQNRAIEKTVNCDDLSIHVLSCHKHLPMLIVSLESMYAVCTIIGNLYIHDDGSMTSKDRSIVKGLFPKAKIVAPNDLLETREHELSCYPLIKDFVLRHQDFYLLKKLIDPFFLSDKKYLLIIDSDLFWYKRPVEIETEIVGGCRRSLMPLNNTYRYVYYKSGQRSSDEIAMFNSGIVLYAKNNFDLEKVTNFFDQVDMSSPKKKHFIEQSCFAFCLKNLEKLKYNRYTIDKNIDENVVTKHYTGQRRELFYIDAINLLKS